jgi:hypothetical protein
VSEQFNANDPTFEAFSDVFARFQLPPDESAVSFMSVLLCASSSTLFAM